MDQSADEETGEPTECAECEAATRVLRGLLFETEPLDPVSVGAAAIVLMGAAIAATWLPARRATRVDPIEVLRAQ